MMILKVIFQLLCETQVDFFFNPWLYYKNFLFNPDQYLVDSQNGLGWKAP